MAIPVNFSNCSSVSGATFLCNDIFAVNGFDCIAKNVTEGCEYNTQRPYLFLSTNNNCFFATSSKCGNKLYILDKCFNEIGSICLQNNNGPLLTVHTLCDGKLLLTYRNKIIVANSDGSTSEIVAETTCSDTDFIAAFPAQNGLLLAFNNGTRETIQLRNRATTLANCVLPPCISIKSFTQTEDCTVYGLFAKGYPYKYLVPIIIDNTFNCVTEKCFGTNLCN